MVKNKAKEVLALVRERLVASETYHIQAVAELAREEEGDRLWQGRKREMGDDFGSSPYDVKRASKKMVAETENKKHWQEILHYAEGVFLDLLPSEWPRGLKEWMKDIRGTRLDYEKTDLKDDSSTVDMELIEALIVDTWVAATTRNRCPGHNGTLMLESDYCPKCGGYRGPEGD